jgi:hypothetical protein
MIGHDPRREPPPQPITDDESALILDEAIATLAALRAPMAQTDPLAQLHALTSLVAQAHGRIPRLVADARDHDHPWTDIARQLDASRAMTLVRYAGRTTRRRTPLDPD